MKKLLIAIICCFFFPLSSFGAVKVSSLYQVELPVSSQSAEARADAIKEGFNEVLIKITGDPEITKNPLIQTSLEKADYYVQEFGYSASTTSSYQYQILIKYDVDDINRLLKKAEAGNWGTSRPLTLVWLAVTDKQKNADIISNEDPGDILSTMKQEAKKMGIPLIFPAMDMADVNQISIDDINKMTLGVLKSAGQRYAPDALLIGKVEQNEVGYVSQWQLVLGKNQWDWAITDTTVDKVIASVLNQVGQALSKHNVAKTPNASQLWLKLEVTHVTERNDLEELMQYLNQLSSVEQVRLSQVAGSNVELSILIRDSIASFQQNAAVGQRLVLTAQDKNMNRFVYEWTH